MLRYTFSLIGVLGVLWVSAQATSAKEQADSVKKSQKVPIDWNPSLVRFGGDIASLATTMLDNNRAVAEGMAEIDFGNWFLVGEIGRESILRGESFSYDSKGNFWRVGADVNMIPFSPDRHVFSVGFRYGQSTFNETLIDPLQSFSTSNLNLKASWLELTGGLRMRMWKQLYMGYQVRLRGFKRLSDEETMLQTFDIPGFGRNKRTGTSVRNNAFGFNYYIYWTIPFREKKIPAKKVF